MRALFFELLPHRAVTVPAVNRSILSRLEGDRRLDSTVGTDSVEAFPLWATAAAAPSTGTPSSTTASSTAARSGLTFYATLPAALGIAREAPLRIALLVLARMDELRSTVLADDYLIFVSHLSLHHSPTGPLALRYMFPCDSSRPRLTLSTDVSPCSESLA